MKVISALRNRSKKILNNKQLLELKEACAAAKAKKQNPFYFYNQPVLQEYARYLIEYNENRLKK